MPRSWHVRITRTAISPRLATRTLSNMGHMVAGVPEGPRNLRFGDIRRFDEVSSTNQVLAAIAREGAGEVGDGIVVVADHQSAGRGRQGRRWEAPPGTSVLVSVLLRPAGASGYGHLTTLAMALAAA